MECILRLRLTLDNWECVRNRSFRLPHTVVSRLWPPERRYTVVGHIIHKDSFGMTLSPVKLKPKELPWTDKKSTKHTIKLTIRIYYYCTWNHSPRIDHLIVLSDRGFLQITSWFCIYRKCTFYNYTDYWNYSFVTSLGHLFATWWIACHTKRTLLLNLPLLLHYKIWMVYRSKTNWLVVIIPTLISACYWCTSYNEHFFCTVISVVIMGFYIHYHPTPSTCCNCS